MSDKPTVDLPDLGVQVVGDALAELPPTQKRSIAEQRADKLRDIEDELLETNLEILRDASLFREIDPACEEPPKEWTEKYGKDAARKFRVARAAWMSAKEAPVALSLAKTLVVGIARARASEKAAPQSLNAIAIQIPVTIINQQFEEVEVE